MQQQSPTSVLVLLSKGEHHANGRSKKFKSNYASWLDGVAYMIASILTSELKVQTVKKGSET